MNDHSGIFNSICFKDLTRMEDRHGEILAFVKFQDPNRVLCWAATSSGADRGAVLRVYDIIRFEQPVLEGMKIWDKLSPEIQEEVINWNSDHQEEIRQRQKRDQYLGQNKPRVGRKQKYPDLPDELVCTKCQKPTKVQKSVLAARIEKKGILADDYVKSYVCRGCNKKSYEGMLDKLSCTCGFEVKYHPSMIVKMAEKKGMTVEDFAAGYKCQKCNPTKGRKKK